MSKISRYVGNLLGFGSGATGTERTIFGSATQSDVLTANISADFLKGWENGLDVNGFPPQQFFNAVGFTATQLSAYLHQMGVAEWDTAQEYHIGSVANVSGVLYSSRTNTNIGNDPTTTPAHWEITGKTLGSILINGNFSVAQDAANFTISVAGTPQYTLDMHLVNSVAGTVDIDQVDNTLSGSVQKKMMQITGAAAVTDVQKITRIESKNAAEANQFVTYSVLIKNNSGAPFTPAVNIKTADVLDVFSAVTQKSTYTFAAVPAGTEIRLIHTFDLSAESTVSRGVEIELDFNSALTSGTIDIGEEKLELGSGFTGFEHVDYADELEKCRRYFEIIDNEWKYDGQIGAASVSVGFTSFYSAHKFKVPSVSVRSESGSNSGVISVLTAKSSNAAYVEFTWLVTGVTSRTRVYILNINARL